MDSDEEIEMQRLTEPMDGDKGNDETEMQRLTERIKDLECEHAITRIISTSTCLCGCWIVNLIIGTIVAVGIVALTH